MIFSRFAAAVASCLVLMLPARGEDILRIAMTASDIPTTTGMPNNGFEGIRFLGYPIFEGLILWDLTKADAPPGLRPGLAPAPRPHAPNPPPPTLTFTPPPTLPTPPPPNP